MSKSKLGQSLMRTIDGGKSKDESLSDMPVDDAFDQAEMKGSVSGLNASDADSFSAKEPHIGEVEEIHSSGVQEKPLNAKPKKVKAPTQKKPGSFIGVIALLVSVGAAGIAGYSVINQKSGQAAAMNSMESLDSAIGTLNTRTDELTAELAGTQKAVQSNSDSLVGVDGIRKNIQELQATISAVRGELNAFKGSLEANSASIDSHQKQIDELSDQIKKLNARAASAPKKVVQKAPVKKVNTDPSLIEGAYVASIDLWGTQPYVMLREENGSWVPLTMGDYYKGWRLEGAIGSEAVFQNGSKTKRLTIKE